MPSIPGQNGARVFVRESAIRRFRLTTEDKPAEGLKIDYAGGQLFTPWQREEMLAALDDVGAFVPMTNRAGGKVWVNRHAVLSAREATPSNGTGTELNLGGLYQQVAEELEEALRMLGLEA